MSTEVKKFEARLGEYGKIVVLLTDSNIDNVHQLIKLATNQIIKENDNKDNCIFELIDESLQRPYLRIIAMFENKVGYNFDNLKWEKFPRSRVEYTEFELKDNNDSIIGKFIFMRHMFGMDDDSSRNMKNAAKRYINKLIEINKVDKKYSTYNILIDGNFGYNFCYRWILLNIDKFNFQ